MRTPSLRLVWLGFILIYWLSSVSFGKKTKKKKNKKTKESYCYDDCSGHGECVDYLCICDPGWHGERCNLQFSPLPVFSVGTVINEPETYKRRCQAMKKGDIVVIGVSSSSCAKCDEAEPEYERFVKMLESEEAGSIEMLDGSKMPDRLKTGENAGSMQFLRIDSSNDRMTDVIEKFNLDLIPAVVFAFDNCKRQEVFHTSQKAENLIRHLRKLRRDSYEVMETGGQLLAHLRQHEPYTSTVLLALAAFERPVADDDTYFEEFSEVEAVFEALHVQEHIYTLVAVKELARALSSLFIPKASLPSMILLRYDYGALISTLNESKSTEFPDLFGVFRGRKTIPGSQSIVAPTSEAHFWKLGEDTKIGTARDVKSFIFSRSQGLAKQLTNENFHFYESHPRPMVMLFFNHTKYKVRKSSKVKRLLEGYREVAEQFIHQTHFVYIDSVAHADQMKQLLLYLNATEIGLTINTVQGAIYKPVISAKLSYFTISKIKQFVTEFLTGQIRQLTATEQYLLKERRSNRTIMNPEEIPGFDKTGISPTDVMGVSEAFDVAQDGILALNQKNFRELLMDDDTSDIAVFCHQAGHPGSRNLAPYVKKIARRYRALNITTLKIYRVDREQRWWPREFLKASETPVPFLMMFPAFERPTSPRFVFRFYSGEFKVAPVMTWIQKNSNNLFTLPELFQFDEHEKEAYKEQIKARAVKRSAKTEL